MKAVVQRRYGDPARVLSLEDLPEPIPGPGQVLVRVRAAALHPDVWHAVRGWPLVMRLMGGGFWRPKNPVPGIDLAGTVEALGPGVETWSVGDAVYGETAGGFQWKNGGTFAELAVADAAALDAKPEHLDFAQAATVPTSALIALRSLQGEGGLVAGQRVLVNGAGGCLGSFGLLLAKAIGAHVTAVDHGSKLDRLRELGADRVLDYEAGDVLADGTRYDLIQDVASTLSFPECTRALTPDGTYVFIGHDHFGSATGRVLGSIWPILVMRLRHRHRHHLPTLGSTPQDAEVRGTLTRLVASGLVRPAVDRRFPLASIHDAMAWLQGPRGVGGIVLEPG